MSTKCSPFPGFTAVSEEVHVFNPAANTERALLPSNPDTVIIFTWGNGHAKHIIKYADSYRDLYPDSQIIIVLCTLVGSMYQTVSKRVRSMLPVVASAGLLSETFNTPLQRRTKRCVLAHIMSNSGTVSFIATLLAYRMLSQDVSQHSGPFPCKLLVFDSAPGGTSLIQNLGRWSHALAVSARAWLPLPLLVMQALWLAVMLFAEGLQRLTRWPAVGRLFPGPIVDPELVPKDAVRLFMYSASDKLVNYTDVERHIARLRADGSTCRIEKFDDSPHVGHMRLYPDRYWKSISQAWYAADS